MIDEKRCTPEEALERTRGELERLLHRPPALIRTCTAYLARARGKFIRASSLLACAADSGNQVQEEAVSLAAAVELLHLATLVHDDVMDEANLRRGQPTLQKKYGKRTAVICGDYLLALALKKASAIEQAERFRKYRIPDYVERICLGELRQQKNLRNLDLSVYRYLTIISGKTAALFEASFYGGAVFSETEESRLKLYRRLGFQIGMIFQLTDDCMDFQMDERTAGKDVQSDFEQGVVTLPLIHTFQQDNLLKEKARRGPLVRRELNQAVEAAGGIAFTRRVAKGYYGKAAGTLDELGLPPEKRGRLWDILDTAYYGPGKRKDDRHECGEPII